MSESLEMTISSDLLQLGPAGGFVVAEHVARAKCRILSLMAAPTLPEASAESLEVERG